MSLREQQVVRLQKEISHTAGVRLTLRRQDCINSIAFVNCFSQVSNSGLETSTRHNSCAHRVNYLFLINSNENSNSNAGPDNI